MMKTAACGQQRDAVNSLVSCYDKAEGFPIIHNVDDASSLLLWHHRSVTITLSLVSSSSIVDSNLEIVLVRVTSPRLLLHYCHRP